MADDKREQTLEEMLRNVDELIKQHDANKGPLDKLSEEATVEQRLMLLERGVYGLQSHQLWSMKVAIMVERNAMLRETKAAMKKEIDARQKAEQAEAEEMTNKILAVLKLMMRQPVGKG